MVPNASDNGTIAARVFHLAGGEGDVVPRIRCKQQSPIVRDAKRDDESEYCRRGQARRNRNEFLAAATCG